MDYSAEFDNMIVTPGGLFEPNKVSKVLSQSFEQFSCVPKAISAPLIEVQLSNGLRYRGKFDNCVLIPDGTYRSFQHLSKGDSVLCFPLNVSSDQDNIYSEVPFTLGAIFQSGSFDFIVDSQYSNAVVLELVRQKISFTYFGVDENNRERFSIIDSLFKEKFNQEINFDLSTVISLLDSSCWKSFLVTFNTFSNPDYKYWYSLLALGAGYSIEYAPSLNRNFYPVLSFQDSYSVAIDSISYLGEYTLFSLETESPTYFSNFLLSPGRVSLGFPPESDIQSM